LKAERLFLSPRLVSLRQAIEAGVKDAVDAFWQEISAQGAPLIEQDEMAADSRLVTFLWFDESGAEEVLVRIAVDGTGQDEHPMTRLLDSGLWHATFRLRHDYRGSYKFVVRLFQEDEENIEAPDPLNSKAFIEPKDDERPDHAEDDVESVVELPLAAPHRWAVSRAGVASGDVQGQRFRSEILGNERRIWVCTPLEYDPAGGPYGLLVVLDGRFFTFAVKAPTILDNLLAERRIRPLVAVMVDNPGETWERSMEIREKELACFAPFADFLAQELVPWLRRRYQLSAESGQTLLAGGSFGGLAAAFVGLRHPGTFGQILALSGSFWWRPEGDAEWEWLARQFASAPRLPLSFYIEVGQLESQPAPSGFPGQLLSNRHLRDVLWAKGYQVVYDEQMHGHDSLPWQGLLAEGLIALAGRSSADNSS
jgi:enterochelin esterase-like enzyme